MDGQATSLLVQNLERLDETVKEEAESVHNALGLKFMDIKIFP